MPWTAGPCSGESADQSGDDHHDPDHGQPQADVADRDAVERVAVGPLAQRPTRFAPVLLPGEGIRLGQVGRRLSLRAAVQSRLPATRSWADPSGRTASTSIRPQPGHSACGQLWTSIHSPWFIHSRPTCPQPGRTPEVDSETPSGQGKDGLSTESTVVNTNTDLHTHQVVQPTWSPAVERTENEHGTHRFDRSPGQPSTCW